MVKAWSRNSLQNRHHIHLVGVGKSWNNTGPFATSNQAVCAVGGNRREKDVWNAKVLIKSFPFAFLSVLVWNLLLVVSSNPVIVSTCSSKHTFTCSEMIRLQRNNWKLLQRVHGETEFLPVFWWHCIPSDACTTEEELTTSPGTIMSDGFETGSYSNNLKCRWKISANLGQVRWTFSFLQHWVSALVSPTGRRPQSARVSQFPGHRCNHVRAASLCNAPLGGGAMRPFAILSAFLVPFQTIRLSFSQFSLETDSTCSYDSLTIHDGGSENALTIIMLCGSGLPEDVFSSGNELYLVFKTDASQTDLGFSANFDFIDSQGTRNFSFTTLAKENSFCFMLLFCVSASNRTRGYLFTGNCNSVWNGHILADQ